jgi:stalled ribosome rescue protein Dom34
VINDDNLRIKKKFKQRQSSTCKKMNEETVVEVGIAVEEINNKKWEFGKY